MSLQKKNDILRIGNCHFDNVQFDFEQNNPFGLISKQHCDANISLPSFGSKIMNHNYRN